MRSLRILVGLIFSTLVFWAAGDQAAAEVIPVPSENPGASPTLTMYWEGAGSKALLILLPGGEGQLNLKPTQLDVGNQFYLMLKQLSQGPDPKEIFDVVLFDSPERLDPNPRGYPISRATADHLGRIHSVVEFYKEKTKKPVWLMGHSNGAVSITEYVRYEHKLGQNNPIAGLIVSGPRKGAYFDSAPLNFPILVMKHRQDGCPDTALLTDFKNVQGLNGAQTSFVYIETGSPENRQVCSSGFHMYNNAAAEVVATLRNFMAPFNQ